MFLEGQLHLAVAKWADRNLRWRYAPKKEGFSYQRQLTVRAEHAGSHLLRAQFYSSESSTSNQSIQWGAERRHVTLKSILKISSKWQGSPWDRMARVITPVMDKRNEIQEEAGNTLYICEGRQFSSPVKGMSKLVWTLLESVSSLEHDFHLAMRIF